MDGDTLVCGDLSELFEMPLDGRPFALSHDWSVNVNATERRMMTPGRGCSDAGYDFSFCFFFSFLTFL